MKGKAEFFISFPRGRRRRKSRPHLLEDRNGETRACKTRGEETKLKSSEERQSWFLLLVVVVVVAAAWDVKEKNKVGGDGGTRGRRPSVHLVRAAMTSVICQDSAR